MKTSKLILITVILAALTVAVANAQVSAVFDSYNNSGASRTISTAHPGPGATSAVGQTFNVTLEDLQFFSVTVDLSKAGVPTGSLKAYLYRMNASTTFGVNGTPIGAVLGSSDTVDVAGIPGGATSYTFNFTGSNQAALNFTQQYCIVIQAEADFVAAGGSVAVHVDSTAPTAPGNAFVYLASWNNQVGVDMKYVLRRVALWTAIGEILNSAFEFWGIADMLTDITAYMNGLVTYWSAALTNFFLMFIEQMRLILAFFGAFVKFFTNIVDQMLTLWDLFYSFINGTSGIIDLGIGNFWDFIAFATWESAFYLFLIVFWVDAVEGRARRTGRGEIAIILQDINQAINLTSFFVSTFLLIINEVINKGLILFDKIVGIVPI